MRYVLRTAITAKWVTTVMGLIGLFIFVIAAIMLKNFGEKAKFVDPIKIEEPISSIRNEDLTKHLIEDLDKENRD
jgi:hypothetical protein